MALNTEVKARELAVNTSKLRSDCDTVAIELDRVLNLAKEITTVPPSFPVIPLK